MKKPSKKQRKNGARGKRPNPAHGKTPPSEILDLASIFLGDLAITSLLRGATFEEKVLIATFIPAFLELIRLRPGTANAKPTAAPGAPEATKE